MSGACAQTCWMPGVARSSRRPGRARGHFRSCVRAELTAATPPPRTRHASTSRLIRAPKTSRRATLLQRGGHPCLGRAGRCVRSSHASIQDSSWAEQSARGTRAKSSRRRTQPLARDGIQGRQYGASQAAAWWPLGSAGRRRARATGGRVLERCRDCGCRACCGGSRRTMPRILQVASRARVLAQEAAWSSLWKSMATRPGELPGGSAPADPAEPL